MFKFNINIYLYFYNLIKYLFNKNQKNKLNIKWKTQKKTNQKKKNNPQK